MPVYVESGATRICVFTPEEAKELVENSLAIEKTAEYILQCLMRTGGPVTSEPATNTKMRVAMYLLSKAGWKLTEKEGVRALSWPDGTKPNAFLDSTPAAATDAE
jgi:hypothetical protein